MIVIEDRLTELFDLLPEIQYNQDVSKKPVFSWGVKEELNRFIQVSKQDVDNGGEYKLYPLIWMIPSQETQNLQSNLATVDNLTLILATPEDRLEFFNADRLENNYKIVLNPLTEYVIKALERSSITWLKNPNEVKVFKAYNYSDSGENGTIDRWDAVRIECEVEFNNNCLTTIQWT